MENRIHQPSNNQLAPSTGSTVQKDSSWFTTQFCYHVARKNRLVYLLVFALVSGAEMISSRTGLAAVKGQPLVQPQTNQAGQTSQTTAKLAIYTTASPSPEVLQPEFSSNTDRSPIATLVQDTSEHPSSPGVLELPLAATVLALAANAGLLLMLYRAMASSTKRLRLEQAALSNSASDSLAIAEAASIEVAQLREAAVKQARLLGDIAASRARTDRDLADVFNRAVTGAKEILNADRVVIYRFYPDWSGYICAEAVASGLPIALADKIEDACISSDLIEAYQQGRVVATNNVFEAGFHPDHLQLMKKLAIQANLVTPILKDGQLFGLLIAHHCSAPHVWQQPEIEFLTELALQVGLSVDRVTFLTEKNAEAQRAQQLYEISSRIRDSLDVQEIYSFAIRHLRETLKTDRVIVYLFDEKWQGTVVAESVDIRYPAALGETIADPCFADRYVEKYRQGRVQAVADIYSAGLTACHLSQLEPFRVKASLIAPILAYDKLHGLLIAHQCSGNRQWQEPEITFFQQVATQMGLALDRILFLEQLQQARQQAELLADEQRSEKEKLQQQFMELLTQIEGAASGNLTVRAEVTAGEIGTVADFFNAIVESLRHIVTRVKQSSTQVNEAIEADEIALQQLANEALKQAEEITHALSSVNQMSESIQAVAQSAHQAAAVAHTTSNTAEASWTAMDAMVSSIFGLRETMSETAHKMKRLGESSQEIAKVVSLINQLALKTNLLAVNASIEAARAGEEGLGFAVVAEEVGELAVQSSSATQEIEKIVENIQKETRQVLEAMEVSTARMVEGTCRAEDAKQNLGQVLKLSYQIDELVRSISETTVSQAHLSQTVTEVMQGITQISKQTSNSSHQVVGSLQKTIQIAQELQASVSPFKVEP